MMDFAKYKHIIWDWNGTLLDDAWLCVEILNRMLNQRGMKTTTLAEYQEIFDFPVRDYYLKIGFDFARESFDAIAQDFISSYEAQRCRCRLQIGAIRVIEELKQLGFVQSVLSASQGASLIEAMEMFRVKDFFENVTGLDDYYAQSKVDAGRKLLKSLNENPRQILLIGDTRHDYEVACQLGSDCVLLPAGHQSKERLVSCGAIVCDSLDTILDNLY
jgi:phosphoglycolate phosphatase